MPPLFNAVNQMSSPSGTIWMWYTRRLLTTSQTSLIMHIKNTDTWARVVLEVFQKLAWVKLTMNRRKYDLREKFRNVLDIEELYTIKKVVVFNGQL